MIENINIAPFYAGQKVVGSGAHPGSRILKDHSYIISGCEYKPSINPIANGKRFWYIGIEGHADGAVWLSPSLVVPVLGSFVSIEFKEVIEKENIITCAN